MRYVLALLLAAGIAAPAAGAHARYNWYWSPERAELKLRTSTRPLVAFEADSISDIDCVPIGLWIWSTSRGPKAKVYKHFDCGFTITWADGSYESVERILHVISAQDFVLSTL